MAAPRARQPVNDLADCAATLLRPLHLPLPFPVWLIGPDTPRDLEALRAVSPAEQARASRFRTERLRTRYLAAHAALRRLIADIHGIPMHAQRYRTGQLGKPRLIGAPQVHFNISYGGDYSLIGIATGREIGVDLEQAREIGDAQELAALHFSPVERASLMCVPPSGRSRAFLTVWTRKEACVKAIGRGLDIPLDTMTCGLTEKLEAVRIGPSTVRTASIPRPHGLVGAWADLC